MKRGEAEVHDLRDDGVVPNGTVPLLLYRGVVSQSASDIESLFASNDWTGSWRNGVYPYHHYHSTTHEVLGCYRGSAVVRLGGERGIEATISAGDVVVIPAGVAHKRLRASSDFGVVGAYPDGRSWDMNYCTSEERETALANIRAVPLPARDPVFGAEGAVRRVWTLSGEAGR